MTAETSSMVLLAVVFAIPAFFTRKRKVEEWLIFEPRISWIMQAIAVLVMQQARYSNMASLG